MFCLEANCGNKKPFRRTGCQHMLGYWWCNRCSFWILEEFLTMMSASVTSKIELSQKVWLKRHWPDFPTLYVPYLKVWKLFKVFCVCPGIKPTLLFLFLNYTSLIFFQTDRNWCNYKSTGGSDFCWHKNIVFSILTVYLTITPFSQNLLWFQCCLIIRRQQNHIGFILCVWLNC